MKILILFRLIYKQQKKKKRPSTKKIKNKTMKRSNKCKCK